MSKVTIDRHEFYLAPGASVQALNATISDTIRSGGGMVTLPISGSREISALVGPGIVVIVEEFDRAEDVAFEGTDGSPNRFLDYDDYQSD
jgi:hypothetical protein